MQGVITCKQVGDLYLAGNNRIMSRQKLITLGALYAMALGTTCLLYLIDGDEPYPNFYQTIIEGVICTLVIFAVYLGIYSLITMGRKRNNTAKRR